MCAAMDYLSVIVRCVNQHDSDIAALYPPSTVQREAIRRAVIKSFSLIQAPPGTGKALTAVRLALLFVRVNQTLYSTAERRNATRPQLMICGPTNKSLDVITSELYHRYL